MRESAAQGLGRQLPNGLRITPKRAQRSEAKPVPCTRLLGRFDLQKGLNDLPKLLLAYRTQISQCQALLLCVMLYQYKPCKVARTIF